MLRCNLPNEIVTPKGITLVPIVGVPKRILIDEIKRRKLHYRVVQVLSKNLRGKLDLHHKPYQPSEFVFSEPSMKDFVKEWQDEQHKEKTYV